MNGEKAFEERMEGLGKDPDLDEVPRVTKHGKKDHEKVTLYKDGIPENIGKKKVEEMFKDYKVGESSDKWHYKLPYDAFRKKYPRISTGCPRDPWVAVQKNVLDSRTQKKKKKHFSTDSAENEV